MNYLENLTYQPQGDMIFEVYPWRLWVPKNLLVSKFEHAGTKWATSPYIDHIELSKFEESGIEFRTFQFPIPNIRFRTEQDALVFILRFCNGT